MRPRVSEIDRRERRRRRASGFTLLEMILVIGTICFLLAVMAMMVGNVQAQSQIRATQNLIDTLESALDTFYAVNGVWPDLDKDPSDPKNPGAAPTDDFEAMGRLYYYLTNDRYGRCMPNIMPSTISSPPIGATQEMKDKTPLRYVCDAWRNPIRVLIFPSTDAGQEMANKNGGRPLIWSHGPNAVGWSIVGGPGINLGSVASVAQLETYMAVNKDRENSDNVTNYRDVQFKVE